MLFGFLKRITGFSDTGCLRILMYHHVLPQQTIIEKNDLTVSAEDLEKQLAYIKSHYNTLFFKDLENNKSLKNKLILTFDDGYYNNLQYLVPLLQKYQLKATIFIPTALIEKAEIESNRTFMTFEEIKFLPSDFVEIGLHSHSHRNYSQISLEEAQKDIRKNIEILKKHKIAFTKALAYPYGKFPKERQKKKDFFKMLETEGIKAALRIGNHIAEYPWKKPFEINRIDIKGNDSFSTFKWKIRLGKTKL